MTNILNQLTRLPRLTRTKFLVILAITGVAIAATLSHADSGGQQPEQNNLAGTWLAERGSGVTSPLLTTYASDGSLVSSRCVTVPTGPTSVELISAGHGQWVRTGHHEFASTRFFIRSGPTVEFTGLVKLTETIKLNETSDQITTIGTLSIYDADNNLLFPPAAGPSLVANRVRVGQ
jgi:hypothetical protein